MTATATRKRKCEIGWGDFVRLCASLIWPKQQQQQWLEIRLDRRVTTRGISIARAVPRSSSLGAAARQHYSGYLATFATWPFFLFFRTLSLSLPLSHSLPLSLFSWPKSREAPTRLVKK